MHNFVIGVKKSAIGPEPWRASLTETKTAKRAAKGEEAPEFTIYPNHSYWQCLEETTEPLRSKKRPTPDAPRQEEDVRQGGPAVEPQQSYMDLLLQTAATTRVTTAASPSLAVGSLPLASASPSPRGSSAFELLSAIHGPCEGDSTSRVVHFTELLGQRGRTAQSLNDLELPHCMTEEETASSPPSLRIAVCQVNNLKPPFSHWLVQPKVLNLWSLDTADGSSPQLDPRLQLLLLAKTRNHVGPEAFDELLCRPDSCRATALHRACASADSIVVRWLTGLQPSTTGGSTWEGDLHPPHRPSRKLLLSATRHGWLALHDACRSAVHHSGYDF